MKTSTMITRTATACFALFCAVTLQAGTLDSYVDDNLDYMAPGAEEFMAAHQAVEPLPWGVEPIDLGFPEFEPDDGLMDETNYGHITDGDGPMVGSNYIRIYIGSHANAGSNTDFLSMRFGRHHAIALWGYWNGTRRTFPRGWTLTWDITNTNVRNFPQDMWDEIAIGTHSGDGIQISRMVIVHSGVEVLNWANPGWLDSPNYTTLGTAKKQLDRKLQHIGNNINAAVHFGARELGKTDGYKYGTGRLWCSEFASWCIWKEGFVTPEGNIGTENMKNWFSGHGRLYTRNQVLSESYVCKAGDYLSLWNGGHSAVFVEWIDGTSNITNSTRFKTIEGNTGQHVHVRTRTVADIDRVGSTQ